MARYSIAIADDHRLMRDCIRNLLLGTNDLEVVGETEDGEKLLALLRTQMCHPELVILDISMPNLDGIEATRIIKKEWPGIRVLIMTVHKEREYLNRAMEAGADGFLLKDDADSELIGAIATIRRGNVYISSRLVSDCCYT